MAATILSTEVVVRGNRTYGVFEVQGASGVYRVDVTNQRCSCSAWKFQKAGADGKRGPCKHLRDLGFTKLTEAKPVKASHKENHPKPAQAYLQFNSKEL